MDNYRNCNNCDRKVNRISLDIAMLKYTNKFYLRLTVNNYYFTLGF